MKNTKTLTGVTSNKPALNVLGLLRAVYVVCFMAIVIGGMVGLGLVLSLKVVPEVLLWIFPLAGYIPAMTISCLFFMPIVFSVITFVAKTVLKAGTASILD